MRRAKKVLLILGVLTVCLQAQTIDLNGKVSGHNGKPVHGAIVTLKSKGLIDTTNVNGLYSLNGVFTGVNSAVKHFGKETVYLKNGIIAVNLANPTSVVTELFDMQGKQLSKTVKNYASPGEYSFALSELPFVENMMIVRVSVGNQTASFRYLPYKKYNSVSLLSKHPVTTAKLLDESDTLQAWALGYKTAKVPVSAYTGTFNITLETETNYQCTQSNTVNVKVSGSGPHKVVVETNSANGINEGTIYRPEDLGYGKKYPIYLWANGACSRNGLSNTAALGEIASHGYFVISDGTPNNDASRPMNANNVVEMGKPFIAYMNWIIAENRKPCSPYYQSIDTTKVAGNGFSCGGLLSMGIAHDPRTTTWALSSSGSFGDNWPLWNSVHTPVLILEGHLDEYKAYENGLGDFNGISLTGNPVMFFSHREMHHGGDLWNANGGHFTKITLAWLNWWMKGDTGATGKQFLTTNCSYCNDSKWEFKSANIP